MSIARRARPCVVFICLFAMAVVPATPCRAEPHSHSETVFPPAAFRSGDPEEIPLRRRTLRPPRLRDTGITRLPVTRERVFLVQFEEATFSEGVAALVAAGGRVLEFVPNSAVSARIPSGVDLLQNPHVRWAGTLQPPDKKSPALEHKDKQPVIVDFFPGADPAKMLEDFRAALKGSVPPRKAGNSASLILEATKEQIDWIAEQEEVTYIFPAKKEDLLAPENMHRCPGPMTELGPVAFYVTYGDGWDGPGQNPIALTYYFSGTVNGTSNISVGTQKSEIIRGLQAWSQYAQISWSETSSPLQNRSLEIMWGPHPQFPFDGPGGTLAYCFYPFPINSEPVAGNMHFDPAENWRVGSDFDLFTVALHEAGHGLGLNHSDITSAVMYAYYRRATALSADDIAGIRALYASTDGGGGGGGGGGDIYEPDDTRATAKSISPNSTQTRSISPATDIDYAVFSLSSEADVIISTSGPSGDTRMWLMDNNGSQIAFDDDGGTGLFSRIAMRLNPGNYYIKVDEYGNNDMIPSYTLSLVANFIQNNEPNEPNNTPDTATWIGNGTLSNQSIRPANDIDYYVFNVPVQSEVIAETTGPSGYDTRLWLLSQNLSQIAFDDDGGVGLYSKISRLAADHSTLAPGTYYLLVDEYGNNNVIPSYNIRLTIQAAGFGNDDLYEPNNTRGTAYYPGFNWEQIWLSALRGPGVQRDVDWYRILVAPEDYRHVEVEAHFNNAQGDIDVALYNQKGKLLAYSSSYHNDVEAFDLVVKKAGNFFIAVFGEDAGNSYDLWWDDLLVTSSSHDWQPPSIWFAYPAENSILSATRTQIWGEFSDDTGVVRAQIRRGETPWRDVPFDPFAGVWWAGINKEAAAFQGSRWMRVRLRAFDFSGNRSPVAERWFLKR